MYHLSFLLRYRYANGCNSCGVVDWYWPRLNFPSTYTEGVWGEHRYSSTHFLPRHQVVKNSQIAALVALPPGKLPVCLWNRRLCGPQNRFRRFVHKNKVSPLRQSEQESSVLRLVVPFFIFYISFLLSFIIDICLSVLLSRCIAFCFSFPRFFFCFLPFLPFLIFLS